MTTREPFAPASGRRFRTDRASGLAGSVERRQDPLGAIQEAQTPRFSFDPSSILSAVSGAPSIAFEKTREFLLESVLPTYVQSTQLQGSALAPPTAPFGEPARILNPRFGLDAQGRTEETIPSGPTSRTSGRIPGRFREALDILSPRQEAGGDIISNALQRFQSEQYAEFQNEIRDFSRQYEERIGQLQDELTKYQGGLTDVNRAYGEYATDADAILKEAASLVAEPLPESAVVETVQASYDEFGGAMADVLKQIDANGNEALAAEMAEQVTYMEDVIVDGLRSGLASQTNLHQLASAQAQALANMAWKDDLYNAEKARFETELQIQAQITAKQEQIETSQREMNRAIADASAQFENEIPSPEFVWNLALDGYFKEYGLNEIQAADKRDLWDTIASNNPQAFENYETFKTEVMFDVNRTNLMRAGLWDDFEAGLNRMTQEGADQVMEVLGQFDITRLASVNPLIRNPIELFFGAGTLATLGALEDKVSIKDDGYTSILDLWSHWKGFVKNYNPTPFVPPQTGSEAPSNYANRNQPDYVYRREVAAPYFADVVENRFPGVEIGGLGYIRPPSDTGGGRSSNSDHQSGGAIDIYFKEGSVNQSNQKLTEIAGWLRMQPWAGLVVFEGNDAHQKVGSVNGHVHLSIQLGYQI